MPTFSRGVIFWPRVMPFFSLTNHEDWHCLLWKASILFAASFMSKRSFLGISPAAPRRSAFLTSMRPEISTRSNLLVYLISALSLFFLTSRMISFTVSSTTSALPPRPLSSILDKSGAKAMSFVLISFIFLPGHVRKSFHQFFYPLWFCLQARPVADKPGCHVHYGFNLNKAVFPQGGARLHEVNYPFAEPKKRR